MGAWGIRVRDNDTAMDFICNLVTQGIINAQYNEEYLVLLEIALEYGCINQGEIPMYLNIIENEIENINSWKKGCQKQRLLILNNLKDEVERLEF